ncbi:MAG: ABC-F family ATP-binding cassette domain-containing protein [Hyphomicrobiaceae bacterium]
MLHINDLTYRIEGKTIFENATAGIPTGHKIGLVGRNGAGKTTLLNLILGDIVPDDGSISTLKFGKIGHVAQEAPGGNESIISWVLSSDTERTALLAEADTATDPTRISDIQIRLVDIDAHSAPARAAQILAGLGLDEAAQQRPASEFSGGWRMRVALASVLFLEPEILLLDEPTNYLDLEGTVWLENYLRSYPHTVVIVSHDRDLLNNAVTSILHLDAGQLTLYSGGYDDFEEQRRETQRLQLKLKKRQDDERRRIQAFVDRFKAKATKAKQAQSRVKALEKMKPIATAMENSVADFQLPDPVKPLASPLLRLEDVTAGYEPGNAILSGLNLRIDQDDRIALLGQNGNGKSTFAKLIARRLEPLAGQIYGSKKMTVGYFAQHQLDDLNPRKSPYDHIAELMPDATEAQKRAKLGSYGFGAEKADTKCEKLSGGEKARLLLAITAFHAPHMLILDEPTNHLDVDSREALIQALTLYRGAVVLISHDRHLVEATADRLWLVADGTVRPYDGDIDSYRQALLAERGKRNKQNGASPDKASDGQASEASADNRVTKADRALQRREAAERRAEVAPLRKRVAKLEKEIERLGNVIAQFDIELADPELYTRNSDRAQATAIDRGKAIKALEAAETEWLDATQTLEDAQ